MKQQIVVTNFNDAQLLKVLGKFGSNSIGLRFLTPFEFAKYVLEINGVHFKGNIISSSEQIYIVYGLLKEIDYFINSSFEDAKKCSDAINELRNLEINEHFLHNEFVDESEFKNKNYAISLLLKKYSEYKVRNGLSDRLDVIKNILNESYKIDILVCTIKECPLTYLETELVKKTGIKYKEISLNDLFTGSSRLHIRKYINGYGSSNEIEEILADIFKNEINPDQVSLVLADVDHYSSLLKEYSEEYNIPMSFNTGISISKSNPFNLLKQLNSWDKKGFHSIDAFKELFNSDFFDKNKLLSIIDDEKYKDLYRYNSLINCLGSLKYSFDKSSNESKYTNYLKTLKNEKDIEIAKDAKNIADELAKGYSYIIENYSIERIGNYAKFDSLSKNIILKELALKAKYQKEESIESFIDSLSKKNILREIEKPGSIYITDFNNSVLSLRPNIYIVGLSADNFPGKNSENSLILDNDYKLLINHNKELESFVKTSNLVIKNRISNFISFVDVACKVGSKVSLSYSSYNLAEIKSLNPSSILFEIYSKENPDSKMKEFEKILDGSKSYYFKNNISKISEAGRKYINKDNLIIENSTCRETEIIKKDKSFSPTHIEKFVNCPRSFYYAVMLNLEEKETDDPFNLLDARDVGTAVHELMEHLAKNKMSEDEFESLAMSSFDSILAKRPPIDSTNIQREKNEFLKMCLNGYRSYKDRVVISVEKRIKKDNAVFHPSGIYLYGSPDVVELNKNGTLTIGDYKTGRYVKHKEEDLFSCVQTAIYAYMTERIENKKVTDLEYRYLRNNRVIHCSFNNEISIELSNILRSLNTAIDSGLFERTKDKDKCKYCSFTNICEGAREKGDKDE